ALRRLRLVDGERVGLAQVERVRLDAPPRAVRRLDRDAGGDRERQAEAVVVVRVLADEVDAAGPEGVDRGHRTPRSIVSTTTMMSARTPRATTRGAQTEIGERPVRERGRGGPLRVRRSVAVSGGAPAARANAEAWATACAASRAENASSRARTAFARSASASSRARGGGSDLELTDVRRCT